MLFIYLSWDEIPYNWSTRVIFCSGGPISVGFLVRTWNVDRGSYIDPQVTIRPFSPSSAPRRPAFKVLKYWHKNRIWWLF